MTAQARIKARWPALMDRQTLAEYLDCSEPMIAREVLRGNIPAPVRFAGRDHWHKDAVDKALAMLSGEAVPHWRQRLMEGRDAA